MTQYLVAVEDPVAAVLLGVRPHALEITEKTNGGVIRASPRRCYACRLTCTLESLPARSRLCHGNGADAFPSSHLGDEAFDLFLATVVDDVRHDDVGVQGETRPRAVGIHSAARKTKSHEESLISDRLRFEYLGQLTAPPT